MGDGTSLNDVSREPSASRRTSAISLFPETLVYPATTILPSPWMATAVATLSPPNEASAFPSPEKEGSSAPVAVSRRIAKLRLADCE